MKYRLGPRIGAGGMAEVYRGELLGARGFRRPVAIKRMHAALSAQPGFGELFTREASISAQLDHPNIVSVYDFDRDREGRLRLVMEFIDGVDLARLAAGPPLPLPAVISIMSHVLRGLAFAHSCGIVHRDVSPHNVLVSRAGQVKLTDFGLAKAISDSNMSQSVLRGKARYLSPEQAHGLRLDGRADLFAVGVMLYELATGEAPFGATGTIAELVARMLTETVTAPRVVAPHIPAPLETIIMGLLERERERRTPTAQIVLNALDQLSDLVGACTADDIADLVAAYGPRPARAPAPGHPAQHPDSRALAASVSIEIAAQPPSTQTLQTRVQLLEPRARETSPQPLELRARGTSIADAVPQRPDLQTFEPAHCIGNTERPVGEPTQTTASTRATSRWWTVAAVVVAVVVALLSASGWLAFAIDRGETHSNTPPSAASFAVRPQPKPPAGPVNNQHAQCEPDDSARSEMESNTLPSADAKASTPVNVQPDRTDRCKPDARAVAKPPRRGDTRRHSGTYASGAPAHPHRPSATSQTAAAPTQKTKSQPELPDHADLSVSQRPTDIEPKSRNKPRRHEAYASKPATPPPHLDARSRQRAAEPAAGAPVRRPVNTLSRGWHNGRPKAAIEIPTIP